MSQQKFAFANLQRNNQLMQLNNQSLNQVIVWPTHSLPIQSALKIIESLKSDYRESSISLLISIVFQIKIISLDESNLQKNIFCNFNKQFGQVNCFQDFESNNSQNNLINNIYDILDRIYNLDFNQLQWIYSIQHSDYNNLGRILIQDNNPYVKYPLNLQFNEKLDKLFRYEQFSRNVPKFLIQDELKLNYQQFYIFMKQSVNLQPYTDKNVFQIISFDQINQEILYAPTFKRIDSINYIMNQYTWNNYILGNILNNSNKIDPLNLNLDLQAIQVNKILNILAKIKSLTYELLKDEIKDLNYDDLFVEVNIMLENIILYHKDQPIFNSPNSILQFINQNTLSLIGKEKKEIELQYKREFFLSHDLLINEQIIYIYLDNIMTPPIEIYEEICFNGNYLKMVKEPLIISIYCMNSNRYGWEKCFQNAQIIKQNKGTYCVKCGQSTGIWSYIIDEDYWDLCKRVFYELVRNEFDYIKCIGGTVKLQFSSSELSMQFIKQTQKIDLRISNYYAYGDRNIGWIDGPRMYFQELKEQGVDQQSNDYFCDLQQGLDQDYLEVQLQNKQ